jgi:MscS family membrane protein
MTGFNLAVHRDDIVSAARFMQVPSSQRANTERLARDLTDLIDRFFIETITSLSDEPDGVASDGLPLNRERIRLTIEGKDVDLELVRVKDPQAGQVWLISSQALAQVPALRRSLSDRWLERQLPHAFAEITVFGTPLSRWVGSAATFVIPFACAWLLSTVLVALVLRSVTNPARRHVIDMWYRSLRPLVILLVTLGIHLALMRFLGFSLRARVVYSRLVLLVMVVLAAALLWRLMALAFAHARMTAQRKGRASLRSLLLLSERVSKTLLVLLAIFVLLTIAGVDTTTALAGVGLGGVAVALGAQKSVENLLGGVFLLTDRALAVGDTCSISNRVGVVEDITMRSVRLRTTEQTLLSIPAGMLSQSNLENFATREKILVQSTLRLRYGTTVSQLRRILNGIRDLLEQRPDVESESARIRLVDFGVRAIELELFAYVLTADFQKFLATREELLLQVAGIVESSGTGFAQPTLVVDEREKAVS